MKQLIAFCIAIATAQTAWAQRHISGTVSASESGQPVAGAEVIEARTSHSTLTESNGHFDLNLTDALPATLVIRASGYADFKAVLPAGGDTTLLVQLVKLSFTIPAVEISALRASKNAAMAVTEINAEALEKINTGKDMPYLLESVPSLVATSDAGNGIGYTGFRIRGSDPTRVNVTLNDIPLNDAESQLVYWVDLPDLATSASSIQVQRGAGTSTNGAGAFGGSVNIFTNQPSSQPYLVTTGSYGSFHSYKSNAAIGTGLLNGKWNFEGRLSAIGSDGYIDRAESRLRSLYISGGYFGKNDIVRAVVLSGKERTYQAWNGVPEASLDTNRTWNPFTYENQVDDYQQDHYQLLYAHNLGNNWWLNLAGHYTYGRGYYEEFEADALLASYNLPDVVAGTDTLGTTDLVRRKWLDNHFYGGTFSLVRKSEHAEWILGGAGNQYDGDHYGRVVWARYASTATPDFQYYLNNGLKTDLNAYAKGTVTLAEKASVYADVQVRHVRYKFKGDYADENAPPETDALTFFNPKAGITYAFDPEDRIYFSFSTANKEPSRDDYTQTSVASRPKHETLYDFEAGYRHQESRWSAGLNYFLMLYRNQLVLKGSLNDVGYYTRINVDDSRREGVELEWQWHISEKLHTAGNFTFSNSRIDEFREYYDDYDNGGQVLEIHHNTPIAFSPRSTAYITFGWTPRKNFECAVTGKYTGSQYLDNTGNENRKLNDWATADFRASLKLRPRIVKEVVLTGTVYNLLNRLYESNGYTYSYVSGGSKVSENFYYPQAGTHFMAEVQIRF